MITKLNWPQARQYASINGASIRREAWAPDGETYRWVRRPLVNGRTGSLWYDETRTGVTKTTTGVCIASSMSAADFAAQDWMADSSAYLGMDESVSPPPVTINPQQILLLEEYFTGLQGNDSVPGGSNVEWSGNGNFPTVTKAFQAGGAVRIGTGAASGSIESKLLDLNVGGGVFSVTFRVRGWTSVEGGIEISATGLPTQTIYYTATMTGSYEDLTASFTGGQADSIVRIATTAKRAFMDNVFIIAG